MAFSLGLYSSLDPRDPRVVTASAEFQLRAIEDKYMYRLRQLEYEYERRSSYPMYVQQDVPRSAERDKKEKKEKEEKDRLARLIAYYYHSRN